MMATRAGALRSLTLPARASVPTTFSIHLVRAETPPAEDVLIALRCHGNCWPAQGADAPARGPQSGFICADSPTRFPLMDHSVTAPPAAPAAPPVVPRLLDRK